MFVSIGLLVASTGQASTTGEPTFWVSKNFTENPNINVGAGVSDFAPEIIDLKHLNRRVGDGDIRLCFDNRLLIQSSYWYLDDVDAPERPGRRFRYCEHADGAANVGYFGVRRWIDRPEITKGLVVTVHRRKITCEAIFTARSLFALLYYRGERGEGVGVEAMKITPYHWGEFASPTSVGGLQSHLRPPDVASVGHDARNYTYLSLHNTWSCLLPAFQLYWKTALARCQEGVDRFKAGPFPVFPSQWPKKINYPLVEELKDRMFAATEQCRDSK